MPINKFPPNDRDQEIYFGNTFNYMSMAYCVDFKTIWFY